MNELARTCRARVRDVMLSEAIAVSELARAGVPRSSIDWFLKDGNVTLAAFERIVKALGYRVEVRLIKVRDVDA